MIDLHTARSRLDAEIKRLALPWLTSIEARADTEMLILRCVGAGHERAWSRPPDDIEAVVESRIPPWPHTQVERAKIAARGAAWERAAQAWGYVAWLHRWWAGRPGEDRDEHLRLAGQADQESKTMKLAAGRAKGRKR